MKEFDVLRKEILRKIYPELNEAESHQIVLLPRQKNLMQFLYYYSQKQLDYVLSQMNKFDCWYKQQNLIDDVLNNFCKNAGWTLDETTSIILGKNPKIISLNNLIQRLAEIFKIRNLSYEDRKNLDDYILDYPIINGYNEQLKQIDLAIDFKEITDIKLSYDEHNNYVRIIHPQKVLKWCKEKEIKLPDGIEKLIEKYHSFEVKKDKEECNTCYIELEQLGTKILSLEKELSVPNSKRAKSLYKAFIGLLALHYTRDKILQSFGENAGGVNPNSKLLISLSKIKSDLDLQGINLDDETIKDVIKESISYLEEKSK